MSKILYFLKTAISIGSKHQSFIDAAWIPTFLRLSPRRYKKQLALWVISLSPHYFFRGIKEDHANIGYFESLESEFRRNSQSRQKIFEQILLPYLKNVDSVIDYGCGAGFLTKAVSQKAKRVFGVDISRGVLECARILNYSENTTFLIPDDIDRVIAEESVDIAYSFAVIQHVTDSVFIEILKQCYNKLKKGGVAIFHMPLRTKDSFPDPDTQRSEGIYGRLKWKYALNYFVRTEEEAKGLFEKTGFKSVQILDIKDICKEYFDDICSQQLIIANKL